MNKKHIPIIIAVCLIFLGVTMRILPHPANFAPVAAISIFGAAILPRKVALWVPLAAMMFSDAIIGLHSLIILTWGCYLLVAIASSHWLRKPTLIKGASLTVLASLFFFVVTNFGVWVTSGMYSHNFSGFVNCYTMAIPFFRNTLLSDVVYTGMLFGIYGLAVYGIKMPHKSIDSTNVIV